MSQVLTLDLIAGLIGKADAPDWYEPLRETCGLFEIDTAQRVACFVSQCAHESAGFVSLEENLNYSAERLLVVFPKYFKTAAIAAKYARKREAIASRVYADRMGNGPEESGDGWRYRGRGLIGITGKFMYRRCGEALGIDLLADPDLLTDKRWAALSAGWFWSDHGLNELADVDDFEKITKIINGGLNGLDDRYAWLDKTRELMT